VAAEQMLDHLDGEYALEVVSIDRIDAGIGRHAREIDNARDGI
jgi:hypothetical protein